MYKLDEVSTAYIFQQGMRVGVHKLANLYTAHAKQSSIMVAMYMYHFEPNLVVYCSCYYQCVSRGTKLAMVRGMG